MPNQYSIAHVNNSKIVSKVNKNHKPNLSRSYKTREYDICVNNEKTTEDDINILAAIRDSGAQLYANKKQDHVDGLRSLKETFKILDAYQNGSIFFH